MVLFEWLNKMGSKFWLQNTCEKVKSDLQNWNETKNQESTFFLETPCIYLGERQICTYDTHKCMKCPIKEQGTLVCEYWWQIIDQSSVGHDQQPALTTFSQTRQHLSSAGGETNMINISPYKKCLGKLAQRCAKQDPPWTPPMHYAAIHWIREFPNFEK